jgi:hypothetical protein
MVGLNLCWPETGLGIKYQWTMIGLNLGWPEKVLVALLQEGYSHKRQRLLSLPLGLSFLYPGRDATHPEIIPCKFQETVRRAGFEPGRGSLVSPSALTTEPPHPAFI